MHDVASSDVTTQPFAVPHIRTCHRLALVHMSQADLVSDRRACLSVTGVTTPRPVHLYFMTGL